MEAFGIKWCTWLNHEMCHLLVQIWFFVGCEIARWDDRWKCPAAFITGAVRPFASLAAPFRSRRKGAEAGFMGEFLSNDVAKMRSSAAWPYSVPNRVQCVYQVSIRWLNMATLHDQMLLRYRNVMIPMFIYKELDLWIKLICEINRLLNQDAAESKHVRDWLQIEEVLFIRSTVQKQLQSMHSLPTLLWT